MSLKSLTRAVGRLPLLFALDSILKGTFFDFSGFWIGSFQPSSALTTQSGNEDLFWSLLIVLLWNTCLICVAAASLILLFSPLNYVWETYVCILGGILTYVSYGCNIRFVQAVSGHWLADTNSEKCPSSQNSTLASYVKFQEKRFSGLVENENESTQNLLFPFKNILILILVQFLNVLLFDQVCVLRVLHRSSLLTNQVWRVVEVVFLISFNLPVFLYCFGDKDSLLFYLSPWLALVLPFLVVLTHILEVGSSVMKRVVIPAAKHTIIGIRDIGLDGVLINLIERASPSWLLRSFFFTRILCYLSTSEHLANSPPLFSLNADELSDVISHLALELLHNMCNTLVSVTSIASIISVISGLCLSCVYKIIGANEEEESLQPVVSGFLFVLLALQTGITGFSGDSRLRLFFQNSFLLVVANQHFVQAVAADLVLKASTDDTAVKKHLRPLLPYVIFFSFPFLVVLRLWEYSFRLSWLLAISAFSLEVFIKSVATLSLYTVNMLHAHTNWLNENVDNVIFYIKAVAGCLEFCCGIFLFINGTYIFCFESGGCIRFCMMVVHFYCNIYQNALKGWNAYKLQRTAWEKVNRLQPASQEQLDENNDICSICYQEMKNAVVIQCSHVFHKSCLQKWLSIQQTCPLCHKDIISESDNSDGNDNTE